MKFTQPIVNSHIKEFEYTDHPPKVSTGISEDAEYFFAEENDISAITKSLIDELKAFTSAAGTGHSKTQLLPAMQKILKKYFIIKDSPAQSTVNNIIDNECKKNCGIELSKEQIADLWND